MKDELGEKIMLEFAALRTTAYIYFVKNCWRATQLGNETNHLEKDNQTEAESQTEHHKDFMKTTD